MLLPVAWELESFIIARAGSASCREYLTGFRKRKNERRKKAQEEEIKKLKDEKKRIKEKKRTELRERLKPFEVEEEQEDDMEALVEPVTYDLPEQTVTVTDVTEVDYVGSGGLMLGANKVNESDEESAEEAEKSRMGSEEEGEAEEEDSHSTKNGEKRLTSSGKPKRKWKPDHKRHKNYTHMVTKHKAKSKEERMRVKRKALKKQRKQ